MKVDRAETLRYLGYQGQEMDSQIEELLEDTARELEQNSLPKSISQEYDCKVKGDQIVLGGMIITSAKLAGNLRGCRRAVLLAATIGRSADLMIKRYSVTNMAKAAIVQAAGASYIESYVDELEERIRREAKERGLYLRPRFSPGYGDFALEYQKDIFAMLECGKRIGLTLTEGNLMMPSKSVTAVIGLSEEKRTSCQRQTCEQCEKENCEFRK
ncbi:MAG: Vitamin B12 dependent methionine synthase activation subunit [Lachnospiraceae bacterium]|nr:Vitamin B12 dependent methionine synthase activation subunit [Lachnospiraceae bacterium]